MITMDPQLWSIGLMTGTVLHVNIDVAMLGIDGEQIFERAVFAVSFSDDQLALSRETLGLHGSGSHMFRNRKFSVERKLR